MYFLLRRPQFLYRNDISILSYNSCRIKEKRLRTYLSGYTGDHLVNIVHLFFFIYDFTDRVLYNMHKNILLENVGL